jgi:UDP-2,3-diacylglucosamine pyrophosphatase LpxH
MAKPARLVVISDLHLGGAKPAMMSQPARLADFIAGLPKLLSVGEALDLVIAGDFVDFLSVLPWSPWTDAPGAAVAKLLGVTGKPGQGEGFAPVFDALREHVAGGHRLTVMLGNHDLELTLPPVQAALLDRIGAGLHDVLFVFDGRAYQVGGALIEHGNRYDDANANDFSHLRALASFLSRGETPTAAAKIDVSTGSQLVVRVVNPLKKVYPFVDLLKPEGELLAYLLFALEPSLVRKYIVDFGLLFEAQRKASANADGRAPGETTNVTGGLAEVDEELRDAFADLYQAVRSPAENVGVGDIFTGFFDLAFSDSVSELVAKNKPIPADRLAKIRVSLRRLLAGDRTFDRAAPDGQYCKAARRLRRGKIETVVMGHTHLARHHGDANKATYINTGTWADLVTVPPAALVDGDDAALSAFLVDLIKDRDVRTFRPTYADVLVARDGSVVHAALKDA